MPVWRVPEVAVIKAKMKELGRPAPDGKSIDAVLDAMAEPSIQLTLRQRRAATYSYELRILAEPAALQRGLLQLTPEADRALRTLRSSWLWVDEPSSHAWFLLQEARKKLKNDLRGSPAIEAYLVAMGLLE